MSSSTSMVMFQKSMPDLVKGIRAQKRSDTSEYVSQAIAEIKAELKSTDIFVKAEAVRKLTYLQMIGYDVSWASFGIVEVMSQPRFAHKRVGYLAANQSFTETTDVILLTTNLFKKEFERSAMSSPYETGLAINSLANIVTHDLARDCMGDMVSLMSHTKPYVRKKAVLAMFKLYVKYPQGLRLTFEKLKDRLDDPEVAVTSCAVNVICELANKNPKNYLAMAPKFFRLLTTSANNWMLIKVVKLLGSLVSEEPRLARKLLEPLATIIQNTTAKSLQFECINTVTHALPYTKRDDGTDAKNVPTIVKLCSDNLRQFIEDPDQNLKYLGLVGLVTLMQSHPKATVDHRDIVLKCLDDDDVTIRTRALELLAGMVTRKTIMDLVKHLMMHLQRAEGIYRDELISKILFMGSRDKFNFITDFAWYTSVLLELASMRGTKHGKEVAEQLIEIALRVDTVRPFTVEAMLSMLLNEDLILGPARITVSEVLRAAAWIVGEYSDIITKIANDEDEDDDEDAEDDSGYWIEGPTGEEIRSKWRSQPLHSLVLAALLHPRATNLPSHVQACYMQAAMKMFVRATVDCTEQQMIEIIGNIRAHMNVFLQSVDLEVQERASTFRYLLDDLDILPIAWEAQAEEEKSEEKKVESQDLLFMPAYTVGSVQAVDEKGAKAAKQCSRLLSTLTAETFYAVHSKAQRRVPVPEGLDLETPFDASAIDALLAMEEPNNLTLATLSFTVSVTFDEKNQAVDEEEARINRIVKNSFGAEDLADRPEGFGYQSYNTSEGQAGSAAEKSSEDRLFYLGGGVNPQDVTLMPSIFGEVEKRNRKGKKGKKDKKSKGKGAGINTDEMLPAGAIDSDDEPVGNKKKKPGKTTVKETPTKATKKEKKGQDKERNALEDVDITIPLKPGESLPVMQHRVVKSTDPPVVQGRRSDEMDPTDSETTKKKKGEKDKKKKTGKETKSKTDKTGEKTVEKKLKKSKTASAAVTDDLLGLDWGAPASIPSPSPPPPAVVPITPEEPVKKSSKLKSKQIDEPKESKKKGSSGTKVWLPIYSEKGVDAFYALTRAVTDARSYTVSLWLRVVNNSSEGINAELQLSAIGTLRPTQGTILRTAGQGVPAGSDSQTSIELVSDSPIQTTFLAKGVFRCTTMNLLGGDTSAASVMIRIPLSLCFTPHKLTEEAFAALLTKTSSKWGQSNAKVAYATKGKVAIKSIANFLHAHIVEAEVSKAASMVAKAPSGASVCCLAKQGKDDFISVDIKVLGTSKGEGQVLADAISSTLSELSL
mmetsp:Transcript_22386/g.22573  ORF Transcript_22386/g.22573 Transcript_22386/m.22573 type:complete len:1277 (+) Transcript_22386:138-3968(+)|eukprot:CAMPEP_0182434276 /NCGR_PEP_ID=MMETSP1167-20130531/68781_1 /TAXON_ID=2988 /ORGANISM="Mallomonas Sp, Strain CCMP3275" /LENGTH=1276 /DNA_ID=CAMNT_0024623953 /DNA_START=54 /DNA_END=3884 /DNA_ORIENTATION=+